MICNGTNSGSDATTMILMIRVDETRAKKADVRGLRNRDDTWEHMSDETIIKGGKKNAKGKRHPDMRNERMR